MTSVPRPVEMRAVFSSLVAVSLLIHAALGCCWHHAHGELSGGDQAVSQCCKEIGHHHDGSSEHGQPPEEPCDGHQCHGLCNYLPIQKSQIDDLSLQLPLEFAVISPAACDVQVVGEHNSAGPCELAHLPPVRLHLLHQILLI